MADSTIRYLQWKALYLEEKPYELFLPPADYATSRVARSNLAFETKTVQIHDVRGQQSGFNLDHHGFTFVKHKSSFCELDDRETIVKHYIPEAESLLRTVVGSVNSMVCFDWKVKYIASSMIWYFN